MLLRGFSKHSFCPFSFAVFYTKQSSLKMYVNTMCFCLFFFLMIILLVPRCLATQPMQPGLTTIRPWRSRSSTRHCTKGPTRPRFFHPHLLPRRRSTLQSTTSPIVGPTMCTGTKCNNCLCLWPVCELFANDKKKKKCLKFQNSFFFFFKDLNPKVCWSQWSEASSWQIRGLVMLF